MKKLLVIAKLPITQIEPVRDTYKIAYAIHFMLGAGNLLPWNALITAVDYFTYLYPSKHVEKVFSVAYMSSSLLVLALMMSWGSCIQKLSFRLRMNIGVSMFVLSLMVTPVMDWWWGGRGDYGVTVGSVAFCGLADGLIGGSLIGYAGKLPKQYMQAVFAGTASSGMPLLIKSVFMQFCETGLMSLNRCSCLDLEDYNESITSTNSTGSPNKCPLLLSSQHIYSIRLHHLLQSFTQITCYASILQIPTR